MSSLLEFLRRQKEKWKYHTAQDDFQRKVAEINRNHREIEIKGNFFRTSEASGIEFDIASHGFIVHRYDLFKRLSAANTGRFSLGEGQIIYHFGDLRFSVTTHEELFILYEIFIQNCYSIEVPESQYIMIDIGMNVGYASLFFARKPSVCRVFGFEPFKPTFKDALYNFGLNASHAAKITPINVGLGLSNTLLQVPYSHESKGKNSMLGNGGEVTETVEIRDACEAIESLIVENPGVSFYVKMDCEGSEFDIFRAFYDKAFPAQIRGILLEWHREYPEEIVRYLKLNAFRIQQRGSGKIGIIIAFR